MIEQSGKSHGQCASPEDSILAAEADSSQSGLLGHMTHAMRTPLSAILGFAQLLESGTPAPTPTQKRSIDRILEAGWYLEKIMGMTRDLALIESGTLALSQDTVPLEAVIADCRGIIESQAPLRTVRMTVPQFETPCFVSVDRGRMQQALGHLLSAALQRTAMDRMVAVSLDFHSPEWIRLDITDVANDAAAAPQTRFRAMTGIEGTEIGLLLAGRLLKSMGGAVHTHSVAGDNTLFSVEMPRVVAAPDIVFHAAGTSAATAIKR